MITGWPFWAQVVTVLGWCGGMGALGGYVVGCVLYRWPVRHDARHRR